MAAQVEPEELRAIENAELKRGKYKAEKFRLTGYCAVQFPKMKRFRRWLFNGLAVLSLLLCVATIILWVRSVFYVDQVVSGTGPWRWLIKLGHATLQIGRSRANGTAPGFVWYASPSAIFHERIPMTPHPWFFHYVRNGTGWAVSIPIWFCVTMPLLVVLADLYRRRPLRPGLCTTCGYDLRATPNRCPECGTVPIKP